MNETHPKPAWTEFQLPLFIIIAVSLAVYSNTLWNGFVWDDGYQVLGNPWIRDAAFLPRIFTSGAWDFKPQATNYYRPLTHVIFMLEYFIFGLKPWGFHLVNVVLHAGSSAFVFLIARELLRGREGAGKAFTLPLMAGVLFAVHPIHTEAVAWVSAITDLSCAFFFLLSLYLYIRSDDRFNLYYYSSIAAFFLATLCKEPAMTLPALIFAYDVTLRKDGTGLLQLVKRYALFGLAAAVYLGMRYHALGGMAPSRHFSEYGSIWNLLIIVGTYLTKLVMPVNLKAIYVFGPAVSFVETRVLTAAVITAAAITLFYLAYRYDKLAFFCLLLAAVPLLPSLYVLVTGGASLLAERYLYLPSAGFAMLASLLIARAAGSSGRAIAVFMFLGLAVMFSAGTLHRNTDWKDDFVFWIDTVKKSPTSSEAHDGLGLVYAKRGQDDLAMREFLTSLKQYPLSENAFRHLGVLYGKQGRVDESIEMLEESLQVKPSDSEAHNELGIQFTRKGDMGRAVEHFQAAVRLDPSKSMYRGNLDKAMREIQDTKRPAGL